MRMLAKPEQPKQARAKFQSKVSLGAGIVAPRVGSQERSFLAHAGPMIRMTHGFDHASAHNADAPTGRYAGRAVAIPTHVQRSLARYEDIPEKGDKNRWMKFYASMKKGVMKGRGVNVEGSDAEWKTHVTWAAPSADDGRLMEANPLGPDHPLGSAPDSAKATAKRKKQDERADYKTTYVAGHLLSEQLGGPGDDVRNLAAIPTGINTDHERKVESKVKKIVNEEHGWVY